MHFLVFFALLYTMKMEMFKTVIVKNIKETG